MKGGQVKDEDRVCLRIHKFLCKIKPRGSIKKKNLCLSQLPSPFCRWKGVITRVTVHTNASFNFHSLIAQISMSINPGDNHDNVENQELKK